jgi:hypothetical protein
MRHVPRRFSHRLAQVPRRYLRHLVRCLTVALALTATATMTASASSTPARPPAAASIPGSLGVQLLNVPIGARNDPRARLYIVDHLHPGTVIHRRIEVSNTTGSTRAIVLYPAAATIAHGSVVGAAGHTANDLSTWTTISPRATEIPAGGRLSARLTIAVPQDASPGEQYGVVWAETRSAPPGGQGITQVSRVGIRLYLSVGPGGPPPSKFTIESLTAGRTTNGQPMVVASVHNTGGRALDMNGTLQLTGGPGGLNAGPFPANLGVTLAIGDTEPIKIILDKRLPVGPWNARVTLRSGLITNSARAIISFPEARASTPPYLAVVAIATALLLIATLIGAARRRRKLTSATQRSAYGGPI